MEASVVVTMVGFLMWKDVAWNSLPSRRAVVLKIVFGNLPM
jgi:hypothetical protein